MKKRTLSRQLCLGLVLVLFLLAFTGCMASPAQATNEDGTLKLVETAALSEEVKLGLFDYIKLPFSYLLSFLNYSHDLIALLAGFLSLSDNLLSLLYETVELGLSISPSLLDLGDYDFTFLVDLYEI